MHSAWVLASLSCILLSFSSPAAADFPPFNNNEDAANGVYGNYTRQAYLSDDSVIGGVANIILPPQPGVSPSRFVGWAPGGPMLPLTHPQLVDANTFATVWSGPVNGEQTMGPTVQSCNGSQYMTWWAGDDIDSFKQGSWYILNNKYELMWNLSAHAPLETADAHELWLTPHCTAILTAYDVRQYNLTYYNITDGWLVDSYFQEIDLATGELLFHWQASAHMNITADTTYRPPVFRQGLTKDIGHDWFHINSVEKDHLGNYLISSRHACTIYYISGINGAVIWRLGGPNNDFKDISGGKATDFTWQHHARWLDHDLTRMSLYDDRSAGPLHIDAEPLSRGMIVVLDYEKKEVRLDHSYYATGNINSDREGSMQVLLDSPVPGNAMIGYGQEPAWSEFAANGTLLLDVRFGPLGLERMSADNYRAIKVNWTAFPYWAPKIAPGPKESWYFNATNETFSIQLHDESGHALDNDTVYFSWNGATEIKSWAILASNDTSNLTVSDHFLSEVPKTGFEDHVFVGLSTKYVAAIAINGSDFVLGATEVLEMAVNKLTIGPAGPNGNDTEALSRAWQKFVANQPQNSLFNRLRSKWQDVRTNVLHTSTPVAAAISIIVAVLFVTLCALPCVFFFRTRQRYSRVQSNVREFSDELKMKKQRIRAFSYGLQNLDEDDNSSERTYYDESYFPHKASWDTDGDLSTLRSTSSCTVKVTTP